MNIKIYSRPKKIISKFNEEKGCFLPQFFVVSSFYFSISFIGFVISPTILETTYFATTVPPS